MRDNIILEVKGISKNFPGAKALEKLDLKIFRGEIHGIVGENGAGKTTFFKIIGGIVEKDEGGIFLEGKKIVINNTRSSILQGISIVHQELSLISSLTVAENIFLGNEPNKASWLDIQFMKEETKKILEKFHVMVDPNTLVKNLPIAQRQIIEICKAVATNPKIIALDEPTVSLNENQIDDLLKLLKKMNEEGITILYVTHRLNEIFQLTDRITVLRDGKKISTVKTSKTNLGEVIKWMAGRSLDTLFPKVFHKIGREILSLDKLSSQNYFKDISMCLHRGEILGIAGLVGCYSVNLLEAIFGVEKINSGKIFLNGKEVKIHTPIEAIKNGIGYIPSDRNSEGLILDYSVKDNVTLASLYNITIGRFIFNHRKQNIIAKKFSKEFGIKIKNINDIVLNLSGGNKQKTLIVKWLACNLPIIILNEPTAGIDVAAKFEIHLKIKELAKKGISFIMISTELEELIGMADRILVMNKGNIVAEFLKNEFNQEKIMKEATKTLN